MGDTAQDRIVDQLERQFLCKICNGILISAKAIDCGHIFCSYCLDLLQPISQQCPECSCRIKSSTLLAQIDKKIESLIKSCSFQLHTSFNSAKQCRNKKTNQRIETINELKLQLLKSNPKQTKASLSIGPNDNNLDKICTNLLSTLTNNSSPAKSTGWLSASQTLRTPGTCLLPSLPPSARYPSSSQSRWPQSPLNCLNEPKSGRRESRQIQPQPLTFSKPRPTPRSKTGLRKSDVYQALATPRENPHGVSVTLKEKVLDIGVDLEKVEGLFGIYDAFLQVESGSAEASGDFSVNSGGGDNLGEFREDLNFSNDYDGPNRVNQLEIYETDPEELKSLKLRSKAEIEVLLKEAEGVKELDSFVQKWSEEIETEISDDDTNINQILEMLSANKELLASQFQKAMSRN